MSETQQNLAERRRRAIYRASHRGTKEMDLVLGRFADAHVATMDDHELDIFEILLALPDPDVNRWTMLQPPSIADPDLAEMVARIRAFHGMSD